MWQVGNWLPVTLTHVAACFPSCLDRSEGLGGLPCYAGAGFQGTLHTHYPTHELHRQSRKAWLHLTWKALCAAGLGSSGMASSSSSLSDSNRK